MQTGLLFNYITIYEFLQNNDTPWLESNRLEVIVIIMNNQ